MLVRILAFFRKTIHNSLDNWLGKRLLNNKKKVRGLDLLTKVQKEVNAHRKIPIVYLKKELKATLNQLENRIKGGLGFIHLITI